MVKCVSAMRWHYRCRKWWSMSRLVNFGRVYSNQCQSWRKTDEGTWSLQCTTQEEHVSCLIHLNVRQKGGFQDGHPRSQKGNASWEFNRGQQIWIHLSVLKQVWKQITERKSAAIKKAAIWQNTENHSIVFSLVNSLEFTSHEHVK